MTLELTKPKYQGKLLDGTILLPSNSPRPLKVGRLD